MSSPLIRAEAPASRAPLAHASARAAASEARPTVSVVIPCRNERGTIGGLLDALRSQTFPSESIELLVVDGMSSDGTREIVRAAADERRPPLVRLLDNPGRTVPKAMNVGIAAASGAVVVRLDAHSLPAPDYVERCVAALEAGKGDCVGGAWSIRPGGPGAIPGAIALAAGHPLGAGDAAYRIGGREGPVDTVPFGAFRRETLARVGPFDEDLTVNQDYELNTRIRAEGGVVWLDPAIRCVYFARPGLRALWRQYWRYGLGKRQMLSRHPRSIRLRQVAPPLFVASLGGLSLAATAVRRARGPLGLLAGAYAAANAIAVGGMLRRGAQRGPALLAPVAFTTMHVAWGAGFLTGLATRGSVMPESSAATSST
jgi:succinoglycan biosynthesis protein ExoA